MVDRHFGGSKVVLSLSLCFPAVHKLICKGQPLATFGGKDIWNVKM